MGAQCMSPPGCVFEHNTIFTTQRFLRILVEKAFTCIVNNDGGNSCGRIRCLPYKVWDREKRQKLQKRLLKHPLCVFLAKKNYVAFPSWQHSQINSPIFKHHWKTKCHHKPLLIPWCVFALGPHFLAVKRQATNRYRLILHWEEWLHS